MGFERPFAGLRKLVHNATPVKIAGDLYREEAGLAARRAAEQEIGRPISRPRHPFLAAGQNALSDLTFGIVPSADFIDPISGRGLARQQEEGGAQLPGDRYDEMSALKKALLSASTQQEMASLMQQDELFEQPDRMQVQRERGTVKIEGLRTAGEQSRLTKADEAKFRQDAADARADRNEALEETKIAGRLKLAQFNALATVDDWGTEFTPSSVNAFLQGDMSKPRLLRYTREARSGAAAEAERAGLNQNQYLSQVSKMRNDFIRDTKEFRGRMGGATVFRSAYTGGAIIEDFNDMIKDPTAARDAAMMFGVLKMRDEQSTVREGEIATVEQARGIDERIAVWYEKALHGVALSQEQRDNLNDEVELTMRNFAKEYEQVERTYWKLASQSKFAPQKVVLDMVSPEVREWMDMEVFSRDLNASGFDSGVTGEAPQAESMPPITAGMWSMVSAQYNGDPTAMVQHFIQQGYTPEQIAGEQ